MEPFIYIYVFRLNSFADKDEQNLYGYSIFNGKAKVLDENGEKGDLGICIWGIEFEKERKKEKKRKKERR